jgi:hypothetical protein
MQAECLSAPTIAPIVHMIQIAYDNGVIITEGDAVR